MPHPEPTRVLLIRHGETAWNVDTRLQGQLDIPLNDLGREQARRTGRALTDRGLTRLYASDLSRAVDTALAIARTTGLTLVTDVGLRERHFGEFQGRTVADIEAEMPEEAKRWRERDPDFGPNGGETLRDFYSRCVSTATRLAAAHPGESVAMVAHGGVLDCLYRAAARLSLSASRTWVLGNASINRVLFTGQGFSLIGWGDVAHLEDPSLDESSDGA